MLFLSWEITHSKEKALLTKVFQVLVQLYYPNGINAMEPW